MSFREKTPCPLSRSQNPIAARQTFRKGEAARKYQKRSDLFSVGYKAKLLAVIAEKRIALENHLWLYVAATDERETS
jgi:hypothetical protein